MEKIKKTSDGKKGGLFVGKSHSEGGIPAIVVDTGQPIEVEGGEAIINKKATAKHWEELSKINQSTGGVPIPPPDRADELLEKFEKGGSLTQLDKKTIHRKWKNLVNMTYTQLKKYYDSKDGKTSGLTQTEADKLGIDSGRESAVWIMKMKKTNYLDWTPEMWRWAKKQISFVSRMRANKGELMINGKRTPKLKSLLIWGHNPYKYVGGGSIPRESKYDLDINSLEVMLKYASKEEAPLIKAAIEDQKKQFKAIKRQNRIEYLKSKDKNATTASDIAFAIMGGKTLLKYSDDLKEQEEIKAYIKGLEILDKISTKKTPEKPKEKINEKPENLVFKSNKYEITYSVEQRPDGRWTVYAESPNFEKNDQYAPSGLASKEDAIDLAKLSAGVTKEEDPEAIFMSKEFEDGGKIYQNELRQYAENILKDFNYEYVGYSDTNGHSMYFKVDAIKVRFSDHSVTNSDRIQNEVHFHLNLKPKEYKDFQNNQSLMDLKFRLGDKSIVYGKREMLMPSGKYLIAFGFKQLENYEKGGSLIDNQLLAPNGKRSNLTPEQYKLVRTPEFKAWFGDWEKLELTKINDSGIDEVSLKKIQDTVSKVVDANGEPMVVYHGTNSNFNIFDKNKRGSNTDPGIYGKGFYFSKNINTAKAYGNYVKEIFLNFKNPFYNSDFQNKSDLAQYLNINEDILKEGGTGISAYASFTGVFSDAIKEKGYDSVITKFGEYVAFEPNQIKLADGTNTTFDSENPDIRFDKGGVSDSLTYKEKYNKKYGYNLDESHSLEEISKDTRISMEGLQEIYNKGVGAYRTNPNSVRPNVTSPEQWAMGRVYSAVMGGKAARIDAKELKMETGGKLDAKDKVTIDIPLLIRILELSREDIKSDAELHQMVERILDLKNKGTLTMDDYDFISKLEEKAISKAHYNLTRKKGRPEYAPTTSEISDEIYSMISITNQYADGGFIENNIIVIESPEILDEINFNAQFND